MHKWLLFRFKKLLGLFSFPLIVEFAIIIYQQIAAHKLNNGLALAHSLFFIATNVVLFIAIIAQMIRDGYLGTDAMQLLLKQNQLWTTLLAGGMSMLLLIFMIS
ncbi:hypothetical protein ACNAN0_09815 [Agrilactobacillus fermenti]|uniref:hypothetical protein n=1 Tax=Agrilactobacillus fermenti TaxID=2586909 RepID=UPI003A5C7747